MFRKGKIQEESLIEWKCPFSITTIFSKEHTFSIVLRKKQKNTEETTEKIIFSCLSQARKDDTKTCLLKLF